MGCGVSPNFFNSGKARVVELVSCWACVSTRGLDDHTNDGLVGLFEEVGLKFAFDATHSLLGDEVIVSAEDGAVDAKVDYGRHRGSIGSPHSQE